jgi:hypothetical protein
MFRSTISMLILATLPAWPLWAQLQIGAIRGKVTGREGRPLEGATVNLRDPRGSLLASIKSGANGEFLLTGIAPGTYALEAVTAQLRSPSHPISVRSALPIEVELRLRAPMADELVVAGKRLIRNDHIEVTARLEVLNVANKAYIFNFGNPFSGTHFGSPRSVALRLRIGFR